MFGIIGSLAKRDNKSVSAKAAELMQTAIELDEDLYYAKICDERMKNTTKFYSHEEVMKMVFKDE